MSHVNGIDFLCGKITATYEGRGGSLIVSTRNDEIVIGPGQHEATDKIIVGRRRMIVVQNGIVWGIFGRPRIRLLQMIQRGVHITEELIECSFPMYPRPERSLPAGGRKSRNPFSEAALKSWIRSHTS